jgi:hypothetical protein
MERGDNMGFADDVAAFLDEDPFGECGGPVRVRAKTITTRRTDAPAYRRAGGTPGTSPTQSGTVERREPPRQRRVRQGPPPTPAVPPAKPGGGIPAQRAGTAASPV